MYRKGLFCPCHVLFFSSHLISVADGSVGAQNYPSMPVSHLQHRHHNFLTQCLLQSRELFQCSAFMKARLNCWGINCGGNYQRRMNGMLYLNVPNLL